MYVKGCSKICACVCLWWMRMRGRWQQQHVNKPREKKKINAELVCSVFGASKQTRQTDSSKMSKFKCHWLTVRLTGYGFVVSCSDVATSSCSFCVDLSLVFCNIPLSSSIVWRVFYLRLLCICCCLAETTLGDAGGAFKCVGEASNTRDQNRLFARLPWSAFKYEALHTPVNRL